MNHRKIDADAFHVQYDKLLDDVTGLPEVYGATVSMSAARSPR